MEIERFACFLEPPSGVARKRRRSLVDTALVCQPESDEVNYNCDTSRREFLHSSKPTPLKARTGNNETGLDVFCLTARHICLENHGNTFYSDHRLRDKHRGESKRSDSFQDTREEQRYRGEKSVRPCACTCGVIAKIMAKAENYRGIG